MNSSNLCCRNDLRKICENFHHHPRKPAEMVKARGSNMRFYRARATFSAPTFTTWPRRVVITRCRHQQNKDPRHGVWEREAWEKEAMASLYRVDRVEQFGNYSAQVDFPETPSRVEKMVAMFSARQPIEGELNAECGTWSYERVAGGFRPPWMMIGDNRP